MAQIAPLHHVGKNDAAIPDIQRLWTHLCHVHPGNDFTKLIVLYHHLQEGERYTEIIGPTATYNGLISTIGGVRMHCKVKLIPDSVEPVRDSPFVRTRPVGVWQVRHALTSEPVGSY